jgi:PAS domain-containing protein
LLPSGKFPRIAVAVALLAALLLFLDLEVVRDAAKSLVIANSLDFFIVFWAALCSFYVARRSSGYPRQLWLLLSIAFALETLAQAISAYYQSFVPGSEHIPWPSDILFFVWAAPVFMIFLPRSDEDTAGIDWIRILDFLQFAIFAVTLYLYFFYAPSRWQSNQPSLLRQILVLYIVRDLLLSLSFFFRSRTSHSSWLRSFSLVLALVFLLAVLSDADFLFTLRSSVGAASLGDLIMMLPYISVIFFAVIWKQPDSAPASSPSPVGQLVSAQILPIAIPLLVIFMGRSIAREQLPLAWIAVTASVVCSSARLILTNRGQRRIADHLLDTQKALRSSEHMFSSAFRSSPDSMSINVFPNGPYLDVNDGFTRITGYTDRKSVM